MTDIHKLMEQIEKLEGDEIAIVEKLVNRIQQGRAVYGPWRVADDVRKYPREALDEVLDVLHYCAAELVRYEKRAACLNRD
jgi:hypothetical protein